MLHPETIQIVLHENVKHEANCVDCLISLPDAPDSLEFRFSYFPALWLQSQYTIRQWEFHVGCIPDRRKLMRVVHQKQPVESVQNQELKRSL